MPKSRYVTVTFDHESRTVVARVYLGTTLAGGDDHDEVVSLNVEGATYLSRGEERMYEEMVIIQARRDYE